jgi:hypothetical protein
LAVGIDLVDRMLMAEVLARPADAVSGSLWMGAVA